MNELSLTLPGSGWKDTTSHHLEIPAPDGTVVALDVMRSPAMTPEALAQRVEEDLRGHRRFQRGFELLIQEGFAVGAIQGTRLSFRTSTPDGALQFEVAYVPLADVLLIFVVRGVVKHAAECGELLREVIGSVRLR